MTLEPRPYVPDDEIDLRELVRTLWRSRLLIVAVTVGAAVAAAAASAFVLPPRYEARAVLMVTGPQVQTLEPQSPALKAEGSLNIVTVLKPELSPEGVAALARATAIVGEVARRLSVDVERIERSLRATVVRNTNLVELRAQAPDRELAKRMVSTWAQVIIEAGRRAFTHQAQSVAETFARQLQDARIALERADIELKEFNARSRIGELQARLGKLIEQLVAYEARRNDLDIALRRAEAELSRIEAELRHEPRKIVLEKSLAGDPFLHEVVAQGSARSFLETSKLVLKSEEQNPVYNALHQARANARVSVEALRAEKIRTEEQIRAIQAEVGRVRAELAAQLLEQTRLNRRVDVARRVYEALLQRREEAQIAASSRAGTVEIVAPPGAGERPVSPRPALNAAVAGVLGFMGSLMGVLLWNALRGPEAPLAVRVPAEAHRGASGPLDS